MKRKLTRNLSLKLLSLVVAFVIWLLVLNIDNPRTSVLFKDVEIQIINEDSVTEIDKVFDIISEDAVVIKVTERKNIVSKLSKDDFTVIADMENLNEMDSVPLTVTCSNSAVTWDEIEISPSSLKVQLEQKTQSEFVINVTTAGDPANGYEVGLTEVVQGKTVQIAGPESLISKIGQVSATVNVNRIKSDQRLDASLTIYDKNGDSLTDTQMSRLQIMDSNGSLISDNTVQVDVTLWEVMSDIPIEVEITGTPADGYFLAGVSTLPVTTTLIGTQETLAELNGKIVLNDAVSVEGATESFSVELDLAATLNDISELRLPSDTDSAVSVVVQIEKSGDQVVTLPLSALELLNRPENITLTFSPADAVSISVHAEDEDSTVVLGADDIQASIDLGVCAEAGTYEIPVEVVLPDGFTQTAEVSIVVTAEEQSIDESENMEG